MPASMRRYQTAISTSSRGSRHSDDSHDSQSTAPTSVYSSPNPSLHRATVDRPVYSKPEYGISSATTYFSRASTETYASTVTSEEELCEEPETYDPIYEVPHYTDVVNASNLRASTPQDFADFFPSTKRLSIRHDDTTYDGNMNLRVDAETGSGLAKETVQLFHMRMHDLEKREFSLRRYERSSGREVCHSSRRATQQAPERRPTLTRSVSNAFATIRGGRPEFKRVNSGLSTNSSKSAKLPKRQDSGYGSNDDQDDDDVDYFHSEKQSLASPTGTNTVKLEFSNYAQVDVKRHGTKSSKRYEFEYWGHTYTWKRVTEKDGQGKAVSYHLFKGSTGTAVAHIVPELRSPSQVRLEDAAGRWVPPCSMWISDKSVLEALTDVADIIVATGLIALIDDCIKRHFHSKTRHIHQIGLPLTPLKMDMEFVGPRAMVEHMFKRRNSGGSTKERDQRGSPLRFANPVTAY